MDTQKAALALAKTIERLAEKNLICEDPISVEYAGHAKMGPYIYYEVEQVHISFRNIKGFADILNEELKNTE